MINILLPLLPKHRIYVEPYFGGGALFFSKGKSKLEVINDTNGNCINFYRVMKLNFNDLLKEIEMTLHSEELHKRAYRIYKNPRGHSKIIRAWAFWVVTNLSFSGKIGGGWRFDQATDGSHIGVCTRNKRNNFKFYEHRLSDVQISNRDALTVIDNRDDFDTFFYLDPPYPNSDQGHYRGFSVNDLLQLLNKLSNIKGKFLLSNYLLPELIEFANEQSWNIHQYDMHLYAAREKNRRKTEVLISNYKKQLSLFQ